MVGLRGFGLLKDIYNMINSLAFEKSWSVSENSGLFMSVVFNNDFENNMST